GYFAFAITPGSTYQLSVADSFERKEDSFQLFLMAGPTPSNDNFADRMILTGTNVSVPGSILGATREADEPNTTPSHSVWWSWTAPIAGVCVVETRAVSQVPVLGVYVGSSLSAIAPVANLGPDPPWGHFA